MNNLKKILNLFFCFVILLLTSCKDNKQNDLSKKGYVKPLHINYEFVYLDNINDPNYLVALLDNSSELESERIGIEGKRSDSYPIYKRLCAVASDTSLLRLTNHKNPKIRVYGMWALTSINRQLALTQMKKLINDNCIVVYRTGCTTMAQKVSWLAASRFNSTEVVMLPRNNSKYLDYNIVIK